MAFDTKKWLVEDMGFTEAEAAELEPKFTGERVKKLEGGYLRQADYSRGMNTLKKSQDDLQAANDKLTNEIAGWSEEMARTGQVSKQQRADYEKAQQDVLRLRQVAERIATDAGLNPDQVKQVLEGTGVVPPKPPEAPAFDTSKLVPKDEFGQVLRSMMHLPAELLALSEEHRTLYGQSLDTRALVREIEARASSPRNQKSLDPRVIWEELHNVADKRSEVEKARIDGLVAEAEKRGREAALSESAIPGQAPPPGRGPQSPILHPKGGERTSVLQRGQPGSTVQKAVAAFRSGKYREGTTT